MFASAKSRYAVLSQPQPFCTVDFLKGSMPAWMTPLQASNGTAFNSSGNLIAKTAPRFDYNPVSLAPLGLLCEPQAINVALWNRDLTNAAWTATNITTAKDQTGIDGSASSASSILATAGNGTILQAITLASSARMQSAYVKRITGTGVVNMTTDGGSTWTAVTVTAGWTRVIIPTQTLANPSVGFQLVTNTDKIAVDFVQNETQAVYPTSAIATTTAAVTRNADEFYFQASLIPDIFSGNGSIIVEVHAPNGLITANPRILGVAVGGQYALVANKVTLTTHHVQNWNGSRLLSTSGSSTVTSPFRVGMAWAGVGNAAGSARTTIVATGLQPTTDNNPWLTGSITPWMYLGMDSSFGLGDSWYGYFRSVSLYNVALPTNLLVSKMVPGGTL